MTVGYSFKKTLKAIIHITCYPFNNRLIAIIHFMCNTYMLFVSNDISALFKSTLNNDDRLELIYVQPNKN